MKAQRRHRVPSARTSHSVPHARTSIFCPMCGTSDYVAVFETTDLSEIHVVCQTCDRVYARKVSPGSRWRDLGPFGRV